MARPFGFACLLGLALCFAAPARSAPPPAEQISVETASTSIYIGRVTLILTPLVRHGDTYSAEYRAKVFPYFFMNEHGTFRMTVTATDFEKLARGEAVEFSGEAENTDREARRVTGRAIPDTATQGKIKVRIFVTKKIQLIFNSTYRLAP